MEFFSKLIRGEPYYKLDDTGHDKTTEPNDPKANLVDSRGKKVTPRVYVEDCDVRTSGDNMEVWADIINDSELEIELDKITLINQKNELDCRLMPGQVKSFRIFKGKIQDSESYNKAQLQYRIVESGDYFVAEHLIDYDLESEDDYVVKSLELITPIRDV